MPLRVLFAASEAAPLVKTGGLADVVGSLPQALADVDHDVRLLLPGYPGVLASLDAPRVVAELPALAGLPSSRIVEARLSRDVPLYAIDCAELFAREGSPYQAPAGGDWPDNPRRFGLLSSVAARLASADSPLDWRPDVLHAHDWQAGLAPAYLAWQGGPRAASVVTIHNLAFKGEFPSDWLGPLGVPGAAFAMHGVEYHGRLSFLKAGLYYADAITTVSPTYAREIQSAPLGMGLEGLLAARRDALTGILNGIDDVRWNPREDGCLAARYSARSVWRKSVNKRALQDALGLPVTVDLPLLGLVSRLTDQKGIDLVLALVDEIAARAQLVVLGTGDPRYEAAIVDAARRHPRAVHATIGFDETLAHRIEAASDLFLMPSRFEPCGMNQMYSQRYGTPPIVHATGGLVDSVVDATPEAIADGSATGFRFAPADVPALREALGRALATLARPRDYRKMQLAGMARDFGWTAAAREYVKVYRDAIARRG